jgi:Phage minor structural protein GP20.
MPSLDNRHKFALPYWARPGIVSFAKHTDAGGGDPDDDDEDDDDEDDDDEDDDPDEGKTPEELAAELKAVRKSLEKANGSSAKRRTKLRERERELAALRDNPKPKAKDGEDDKLDVETIRNTALAEGKKAGERLVKSAKVEAGLARAGVTDTKTLARLTRMIDLDELDLEDDGTLDGLEDAIDELKADMPALFGGTRKRRTVAGDADRDGDRAHDRKPKSASEKQAASLLGKG